MANYNESDIALANNYINLKDISKSNSVLSDSDISPTTETDYLNPPSSPLKDAGNMYNERGFYKSNGFSFDDQEIINDFNWNLKYGMPLYNYALGGDLNLNMRLTYNGSVSRNLIVSSVEYQNSNQLTRFGNRYCLNAPEKNAGTGILIHIITDSVIISALQTELPKSKHSLMKKEMILKITLMHRKI